MSSGFHSPNPKQSPPSRQSTPPNSGTTTTPRSRSNDTCYSCNREGHWAQDCPNKGRRGFSCNVDPVTPQKTAPVDDEFPARKCPCGTGDNRGRKFYCCPVTPQNKSCCSFMWCDQAAGVPEFRSPECKCGAGVCTSGIVKRAGPNYGRLFFACRVRKGEGACDFFRFLKDVDLIKNSPSGGPNNQRILGNDIAVSVSPGNGSSPRISVGSTSGIIRGSQASTSSCPSTICDFDLSSSSEIGSVLSNEEMLSYLLPPEVQNEILDAYEVEDVGLFGAPSLSTSSTGSTNSIDSSEGSSKIKDAGLSEDVIDAFMEDVHKEEQEREMLGSVSFEGLTEQEPAMFSSPMSFEYHVGSISKPGSPTVFLHPPAVRKLEFGEGVVCGDGFSNRDVAEDSMDFASFPLHCTIEGTIPLAETEPSTKTIRSDEPDFVFGEEVLWMPKSGRFTC